MTPWCCCTRSSGDDEGHRLISRNRNDVHHLCHTLFVKDITLFTVIWITNISPADFHSALLPASQGSQSYLFLFSSVSPRRRKAWETASKRENSSVASKRQLCEATPEQPCCSSPPSRPRSSWKVRSKFQILIMAKLLHKSLQLTIHIQTLFGVLLTNLRCPTRSILRLWPLRKSSRPGPGSAETGTRASSMPNDWFDWLPLKTC